jgi:hypothetical protein
MPAVDPNPTFRRLKSVPAASGTAKRLSDDSRIKKSDKTAAMLRSLAAVYFSSTTQCKLSDSSSSVS